MSCTICEYKNLTVTPKQIPHDGKAELSIVVTNTGKRKGDEMVQLYIHDMISVPTRPIKELKDFIRITLNPGESRTVRFTITPEKLEALNIDMKREVQPGDFEIMVGKNSVEVLMDTLRVK